MAYDGCGFDPSENHARLVPWFWPRLFLCPVPAVLHLHGGLSTSQSRSLASLMRRRVCLREYGPSLRGRIHQLACWAIFLRGRLRERVQGFLYRAYKISFSRTLDCRPDEINRMHSVGPQSRLP